MYLNYHTLDQVLIGLAVGAATGAAWFFVVDPLLAASGIFTTPLARALFIRDYGPIPNAIAFEYVAVQRAIASHQPDALPANPKPQRAGAAAATAPSKKVQ